MASQRDRLPFEPARSKRKEKSKPEKSQGADTSQQPPTATAPTTQPVPIARDKANASLAAIPEAVSRRMVRRMAIATGVPTGLGIASFFAFYVVVTQEWFELPASAVLLVTAGLFGLGVVGLSYGILSASWDEQRVGSFIGWEEFTLNAGRVWESWRAARREARGTKE